MAISESRPGEVWNLGADERCVQSIFWIESKPSLYVFELEFEPNIEFWVFDGTWKIYIVPRNC